MLETLEDGLIMVKGKRKRKSMESRKYAMGCKPFLVSIGVGEEKEIPQTLKYHSIKSIISRMRDDYGCVFKCRSNGVKKYVKRMS